MTNEKVDEKRLAYLAGLFEGEGSSMIMRSLKYRTDKQVSYTCKLKLQMTDYEPVQLLFDTFGGHLEEVPDRPGNRRGLLTWWISGIEAGKVAKILLPCIVTPRKREALQCVIDFAETIIEGYGRWNRLTAAAKEYRLTLRERCKAYNKKGVNANNRGQKSLENIKKIKHKTNQLTFWENAG